MGLHLFSSVSIDARALLLSFRCHTVTARLDESTARTYFRRWKGRPFFASSVSAKLVSCKKLLMKINGSNLSGFFFISRPELFLETGIPSN